MQIVPLEISQAVAEVQGSRRDPGAASSVSDCAAMFASFLAEYQGVAQPTSEAPVDPARECDVQHDAAAVAAVQVGDPGNAPAPATQMSSGQAGTVSADTGDIGVLLAVPVVDGVAAVQAGDAGNAPAAATQMSSGQVATVSADTGDIGVLLAVPVVDGVAAVQAGDAGNAPAPATQMSSGQAGTVSADTAGVGVLLAVPVVEGEAAVQAGDAGNAPAPATQMSSGQAATVSADTAGVGVLLGVPVVEGEAVYPVVRGWLESQASYSVLSASVGKSAAAAGQMAESGGNQALWAMSEAAYSVEPSAALAALSAELAAGSPQIDGERVGAWLQVSGFPVPGSPEGEAAQELVPTEGGSGAPPQDAGGNGAKSLKALADVRPLTTVTPVEGDSEAKIFPVAASGAARGQPKLVGLEEFAVRSVRYLVLRGERTITVRLVPESLGEVRFEVHTAGDALNVRLFSPNPAVREALEGQLPWLRESLVRNGIDVARMEVAPELLPGDASQNYPSHQTPEPANAAGPEARSRPDRLDTEAHQVNRQRRTLHEGLLDMLV